MRKVLCLIICFATLLTVLASPLQASAASEDMIAPCYENAIDTDLIFKFSNNVSSVIAQYQANTATFVQARLTVKIQQSFLWIFWIDVGSELVGTSTDAYGEIILSKAVSAKGVYRAVCTLEIIGTSSTDVIEQTLEDEYK